MTTPYQPAPDGAYIIGGGDWNYGQTLNEDIGRAAFEFPMANPDNMLDLLRIALERIPLEGLQPFAAFLGVVDGIFDTIGDAVDAIMNSLTLRPIFQTIQAFTDWVTDFFGAMGALVTGDLGEFSEWFQENILMGIADVGEAIGDLLTDLWNDPMSVIGQIGQGLVDGLEDALEAITGDLAGVVSGLANLITDLWNNTAEVIGNISSAMVDGLDDALGFLQTAWNQIGDIVQGNIVVPISAAIGHFQEWWQRTVGRIQEAFDDAADFAGDLWGGLLRVFGLGPKSSSEVSNAAADLADKTEKARDLGEWNNAILGVRNNKSIMQGVDESEESTFLMSDLFTGGAAPPLLNVTSAAVPVAFWRATEWATKGFISWFGEGYTNVTGLYIDLYKMNYETESMELFHSSDNLVGLADTTWKYMVYYLPSIHRFEVFPGDVIGIGMRVTGSGTHKIAGKSAPWLPGHPTVHPAKPAATKTGVGNVAFGSLTYSTDLPWFGIGIVEGDAPPLFFTPRTTVFSTTGAHTYTIPSWANFVDVILCGAGGGGHGGNYTGQGGEGGDAGTWASETLERGVDFPVGATTLTFHVGSGGAAGGTPSGDGGTGGSTRRAAIASGKAVFTAAGGAGGNSIGGSGENGDSPGNYVYNGTVYVGGSSVPIRATQTGLNGKAPGGGGAGGSGGAFTAWSGGVGGIGTAWAVARQS